MQHKFLLRFIKQEMQRQKIPFKNNEAFFRLFVADEPWESYRSNMSNWLSSSGKDGVIHKHTFITAINEKLGLSPEVWGASEQRQKEAVVQGVGQFKLALEKEASLFSLAGELEISEKEEAFIAFSKDASVDEVEEKLGTVKECFVKRSHAQTFLIALLEVMYEKGAYAFVYEQIFPYLLDTYDNSIKAKKAHIYASLPTPMYREAFDILSSIRGNALAETIDLQTSAISNIRRERLSSEALSRESLKGLLHTLTKSYSKIYMPKEAQGYYVGINLAYTVALAEAIFPNERELVEGYSVVQIYKDVQKSMAKAAEERETQYYAAMSEIEFQLLLGKHGVVQALEYLLETLQPSQNLIDQTQRQMGLFFVDVVEKFAARTPKNLQDFKTCLSIFDAYTDTKQTT